MRSDPADPRGTARIILVGIAALAVAMGIGRFAFTPLLPLMLRDGLLDASTGTEWAAANYVGYLLGALTASRFARDPFGGMRLSLWGVALTTLLAGVVAGPLPPIVGALLRLAAGVFSAWTLVCASSWCLTELARRDAAARTAWVYTGVGAGICVAGLFTWIGGGQPARTLWLELALVASAGALLAAVRQRDSPAPDLSSGPHAAVPPPMDLDRWALVACYGSFGFGYIVPATFLPAMAREQVADPLVFGLTWPLFGLAAVLSVAAAGRWLAAWPRRRTWALAQATMALGTAVSLVAQAMWALAASAVLVGGTFMVATMAGLQLARELAPRNPTPLLARMTVAFAAGQIIGPLFVRALGPGRIGGHDALWWANATATLLLVLTAAWLARGSPSRPQPTPGVFPMNATPSAQLAHAFPEFGLPERIGPPSTLDPRQQAAADDLVNGPRRGIYGPFRPLLHTPDLLNAVAKVGEALRYRGTLDACLREWTICVVARELSNVFEWDMHLPLALAAGVPAAALAALADDQPSPAALGADLALSRQLARELTSQHRLTDATYARAIAQWKEATLVELLTLVGYFSMVCCLMNVARTPGPSA